MKLDKVENSKNDEFYTPAYAISPILKYVPSGSAACMCAIICYQRKSYSRKFKNVDKEKLKNG